MHLLTTPQQATFRTGSRPILARLHTTFPCTSCRAMWRLRSGFEMSSIVKITKRKCNAIQFEICIHEKSIKKKRHCSGAFSAIPSSRLDFPQEPEPGRRHGLWRAGSNANTPPPKGLRGSWSRGPESLPINTANVMGGARNARPPCPGAAAPLRVCPGAPPPVAKVRRTQREKKKEHLQKRKGGGPPHVHRKNASYFAYWGEASTPQEHECGVFSPPSNFKTNLSLSESDSFEFRLKNWYSTGEERCRNGNYATRTR